MLRIGVIGAGVMGTEHARLIREEVRGATLVAVCDSDVARAKAAAGAGAVFSDPLKLINDNTVDAVVVVSPDSTHADLAIACIEVGKPVLCEKPLGISAEDAFRVVEAEAKSGRALVQVGYNRRFDPSYLEMRNVLRSGRIGEAVLLHNIHRNQAAPDWFVGAMPLTNSFVHEADISRWLLGEEFTYGSLSATTKGDPMMVTLETVKGQIVSSELFLNAAYGYHVHAELVGSKGTVALAQPSLTVSNHANQHGHHYPENWVPRFAESYRRQMDGFIRFAKAGVLEGASAYDGYVATAIAEQLVKALGTRQTIELTLAPRP